ncbi:MAG: ADOP family duplicated permease [Candidatus Acidiferrales bacterium]
MRWLQRLFHKSSAERELDQELRFHLEQQILDNLAAGMSPEEARRDALIKLGGIERVKEEVRDTRWERHVDNIVRDFRCAIRNLRKDSRSTLIAILALALGIGACTVVFSVVYNVFVNALPYKNFSRSVIFKIQNLENAGGWRGRDFFYPEEFRAFREQNHVFEEMMATARERVSYDDGKSVRYWPFGATVTSNTFDFLGVEPLLGRTISQEDAKLGTPPVFVMNYRLWQTEFAGDPKILNTSFILNGMPTILVGIMPQQFNAFDSSYWVAASDDTVGGTLIGRLKPGIGVRGAAADLDAIAHRLQKVDPKGRFPEKFAIVAEPLLDRLIGGFRKTLYSLLAAVLLLLLIACSNVASLLLARATAREREMAMRSALGATRGRLVRQLLVESFVLAAAACGAGCVLAYFALRIVVALIPAGTLPDESVIRINGPVLLLSMGAMIVTTILCGLAPALHVVRSDLQPRLAGSGKGVGGSFRHEKLRAGLVVSEVALSILLLIGAGLLLHSFFVLTRVDLGFDPKNVLYFELNLPRTYNTDVPGSREKKNELTRQLLDRLRAMPGVISVAESNQHPPLMYEWSDIIIPGRPHAERWETRFESVSEGYFQILGLPLVRGRFLSGDDVTVARDVMVVNQAFAREYFPNEDPIGHKVKLAFLDQPFLDAPHDTYFEIVGIVRDYKTRNRENPAWESFPEVFFPYSVQGYSWRTFMARTAVVPNSLLKNVGQEVRALDPAVRIAESGTLEGALREYYRGPQFELATLAAFALTGLLLVVIGIFSVMAYTVSLQTHEIGVRMALGAQQTDILRLVLVKGFRLVMAGILFGLLASYVLTRFLASEISGVSTTDPWTFVGVVAIVVFVGLAACLVPARSAARVDPIVALRYE